MAGGVVGGGLDGPKVGVGVGDVVTVPVQATPLRVNAAGIGLLLLFQAPLKPKVTLPPVGMPAL